MKMQKAYVQFKSALSLGIGTFSSAPYYLEKLESPLFEILLAKGLTLIII
jgi:hypothetical protein